MKVFISYRRDDSIIHARLIRNELAQRFGDDDVFMDIDDIDYGEDFARKINERLDAADAVVAVIGPQWLDMLHRRAHGDDYVRHELSRALAGSKRIVPVLVGKATPPGSGLPEDLAALRKLNALHIDERSLRPHVTALVEALREESFEGEVDRHKRRRLARWTGAGVGVAMFFAAWFAVLDGTGLDMLGADLTMQAAGLGQAPRWSGEVVVVGIDEGTLKAVGREFGSDWRREHAQLVERLAAAGVRTTAFDLFFERAANAEADDAFEAAIRAAKAMPVVLGVRRTEGTRPAMLPRFAAVAVGGVACVGTRSGYARSAPLAVKRGERAYFPSLALAAYTGGGKVLRVAERERELRVEVSHDDRSPAVKFSTAENVSVPTERCGAIRPGDRVAMQWLDPALIPPLKRPPFRLAYEDVLTAKDPAALARLKDKIVLVGTMLEGRDAKVVPGLQERFGVELIAAQIDAMLRNEVVRPIGWQGLLVAMVGMSMLAAGLRMRASAMSAPRRIALLAGCALGAFAFSVLVYRLDRAHVGLAYLLAALVVSWSAVAWLDKRGWRWSRA